MDREKTYLRLSAAALAVALCASAVTGCDRQHRVVVGSKNFTEQVVLGEIIAQHVEHRLRVTVDRRLNLGGTLLAHQALVNGDLDLYPEYTGTAMSSILKLPAASEPVAVLQTLRTEYERRFRLQWLDPLGFNNTFAMVIRGEDSRQAKTYSLSDATKYGPGWKLGVGYEFQQRPDGLPGLLKTYPLPLKDSIQTMDLGLLYKALEQKQVDMVAGNATDGQLSVLDIQVLEDDKHYFPPYQAAIVVRSATLASRPELASVLKELSGKFSDAQMRTLNYQVDGQHRSIAEVAQDFLRTAGLRE